MKGLTVGADPEVWAEENGVLVSAHGMVAGDKKNPLMVRSGAVQVDGMALEFNIDPASSEELFLHNISDVLGQLKSMIGNKKINISPVAEFGEEYIKAQPDMAKELGCDADFNAWTSLQNPVPDGSRGFRTAAGHVHVGWTKDANIQEVSHLGKVEQATQQLDFFLGLPSILYDDCTKRREMYGKAGAYRPKSYGLEYRTLSNLWLTSHELMSMVYKNIHQSFEELLKGNTLSKKYGNIEGIINGSQKDRAIAIMKEEGICYEA